MTIPLKEINKEDSNIYNINAVFELSLPYYKDKAYVHMFMQDLLRRLAQENTDERTLVKMKFKGCDTNYIRRQVYETKEETKDLIQHPFEASKNDRQKMVHSDSLRKAIDKVDKALEE